MSAFYRQIAASFAIGRVFRGAVALKLSDSHSGRPLSLALGSFYRHIAAGFCGLVALSFTLSSPAHAQAYPEEVQRIILNNCVGLNRKMVEPCTCMLRQMQASIPFKQYEVLIQKPNPMNDPRMQLIVSECRS